MKINSMIIIIFVSLFLFGDRTGLSADFNPTVMKIEGNPSLEYWFMGRDLDIPFTLSGTSALIWLIINTKDAGSQINNVRTGYLGWHYVNKIDTTIYISQVYKKEPGENVIVWDGYDENGNEVSDGQYNYYLWGYDSKSSRQFASSFVMPGFNWESQFTSIVEKGPDGLPLANPILFGSQAWWLRQADPSASDYSWKAHGTTFKWFLGSDPEDVTQLQTTRCPGYDDAAKDYSYGGPVLNPKNYNEFYHCSVEINNKIETMLKWTFVPNGEAVKDESWGGWNNVALEDHGMAAGRWSQKPSCYTDGNYIYQVSPGLHQKTEEWNKLRVYSFDDGSVVIDKMIHDWYMPDDKNPYGYINGAFNKMASRTPNQWLLLGQLSCMHQMINTSRLISDQDDDTDMVMWRNSNGDYFLDNAYSPMSEPAWYCLEIDDSWHRRGQTDSVSIDSNGFNIFGLSYNGLMSFAVSTQDGSAVDYMSLRDDWIGDAPYKNGGYILCDSGSAFDGLYTCGALDGYGEWQLSDKDDFVGNDDLYWVNRGQTYYVAFDSFHGIIRHWADGFLIEIVYPNGGEILSSGSECEIKWNSQYYNKNVKIEYSIDDRKSWITIIEKTPSNGSYIWTIPDIVSDKCRIKITDIDNSFDYDKSENTFSIINNIDSADSYNPSVFTVSQNSPNPFNPSTSIDIVVPSRNIVKAEIYSVTGRKAAVLADGVFEQGRHTLKWNAAGFSAGVYFCKLSLWRKNTDCQDDTGEVIKVGIEK